MTDWAESAIKVGVLLRTQYDHVVYVAEINHLVM